MHRPFLRSEPRQAILVLGLGFAIGICIPSAADARGGGRGFGHAIAAPGHGTAHFERGRRHGNDQYVKTSSSELDKLLTQKLKSICRGC